MAADKKLNSVNLVNDASYVYAETASGETVKISKADLASVVAGLIGDGILTKGEYVNNLDEFKEQGVRYVQYGATGYPLSSGGIVIYIGSSRIGLQVVCSGTNLSARLHFNGEWDNSGWKSIY